MFGAPVRVFAREEIHFAIELAVQTGLVPTATIDLTCDEKVVRWEDVDLEFTFLIFCLRKL
jgi:hypothetical protein